MRRILSKRKLMALGALSFLAGLAMVGVGLYSYFGQGDSVRSAPVTSNRPFVSIIPTPPPTVAPEPTIAPPAIDEAAYQLIIDAIGVNAPVRRYGLDPVGVPIVPTGADANDVVAWYEFSAEPGRGSNSVFAGHVDWNGHAVFWDLNKLAAGDVIQLKAQDGTELTYSVFDNFSVDPNDPASLQVMAPTPTDVMTLITCGGSWIPDSSERYGGSYDARVIVRAGLVSINAVGSPETSSSGGG